MRDCPIGSDFHAGSVALDIVGILHGLLGFCNVGGLVNRGALAFCMLPLVSDSYLRVGDLHAE